MDTTDFDRGNEDNLKFHNIPLSFYPLKNDNIIIPETNLPKFNINECSGAKGSKNNTLLAFSAGKKICSEVDQY